MMLLASSSAAASGSCRSNSDAQRRLNATPRSLPDAAARHWREQARQDFLVDDRARPSVAIGVHLVEQSNEPGFAREIDIVVKRVLPYAVQFWLPEADQRDQGPNVAARGPMSTRYASWSQSLTPSCRNVPRSLAFDGPLPTHLHPHNALLVGIGWRKWKPNCQLGY
jgi:hypothetical protein